MAVFIRHCVPWSCRCSPARLPAPATLTTPVLLDPPPPAGGRFRPPVASSWLLAPLQSTPRIGIVGKTWASLFDFVSYSCVRKDATSVTLRTKGIHQLPRQKMTIKISQLWNLKPQRAHPFASELATKWRRAGQKQLANARWRPRRLTRMRSNGLSSMPGQWKVRLCTRIAERAACQGRLRALAISGNIGALSVYEELTEEEKIAGGSSFFYVFFVASRYSRPHGCDRGARAAEPEVGARRPADRVHAAAAAAHSMWLCVLQARVAQTGCRVLPMFLTPDLSPLQLQRQQPVACARGSADGGMCSVRAGCLRSGGGSGSHASRLQADLDRGERTRVSNPVVYVEDLSARRCPPLMLYLCVVAAEQSIRGQPVVPRRVGSERAAAPPRGHAAQDDDLEQGDR